MHGKRFSIIIVLGIMFSILWGTASFAGKSRFESRHKDVHEVICSPALTLENACKETFDLSSLKTGFSSFDVHRSTCQRHVIGSFSFSPLSRHSVVIVRAIYLHARTLLI